MDLTGTLPQGGPGHVHGDVTATDDQHLLAHGDFLAKGAGFVPVVDVANRPQCKTVAPRPMIYSVLVPTLILTAIAFNDEQLSKVLGLAWDAGAVTTGPITVPLVLSLGIGIASAAGKGSSSLSGFGIVTLASMLPIIAVLMLAFYIGMETDPAAIIAAAQGAQVETTPGWYEQTPVVESILAMRAILPLVVLAQMRLATCHRA